MNIEVKLAVLEALVKNEEAISRLYEVFSRQFQNIGDFWEQLALEELSHARAIRSLYPRIKDGSIGFNPDRFKMQAIEYFHSYVQELIMKTEGRDLVWAFSVAVDVERSLLESQFFSVFEADSKELRDILNKLAEDTRRHFKNIKEAWDRFRGGDLS